MTDLRLVEPHFVITRAALVDALTKLEARPALANGRHFVVAEDMADALLADMEHVADDRERHRAALIRLARDLILLRGASVEDLPRVDDVLLRTADQIRRVADEL